MTDRPSYFRIGAVTKMTGIPMPTIRMWERRYQVVEPKRAEGGGRLYSEADVTRLSLLRQATEADHAIGTIAKLDNDSIRQRLQLQQGVAANAAANEALKLAVAGPTLGMLFQSYEPTSRQTQIVAVHESADLAMPKLLLQSPTAVILEYLTLHASEVEKICAFASGAGAVSVLVVYRFASQRLLQRLEQYRIVPVKGPVNLPQLEKLCLFTRGMRQATPPDAIDGLVGQQIPPPSFTSRQLAQLGSVSTVVKCQCPQQLAELLLGLGAFEKYSAECENQNAADSALHALLHATAAKSRHLMEQALTHVLRSEGITLPSESKAA